MGTLYTYDEAFDALQPLVSPSSGSGGSGGELSDAVDSDSSTSAASSKAVKTAYDAAVAADGKAAAAQTTANEAKTAAATAQTTANSKWTAVDGTTSVKGIVQLSDAIDSTSTALAATANAAKTAYDKGVAAETAAGKKWAAPNYAGVQGPYSFALNDTYTAPSDGWYCVAANINDGFTYSIYISGTQIGASAYSGGSGMLPVAQGDTITLYCDGMSEDATIYFIPAKT